MEQKNSQAETWKSKLLITYLPTILVVLYFMPLLLLLYLVSCSNFLLDKGDWPYHRRQAGGGAQAHAQGHLL